MKYEYTPFFDEKNPNSAVKRKPFIDLELFGPKGSISVSMALVDSGADYCLFNIEYAKQIGINLDDCLKMDFTGISGLDKKMTAYIAEVGIKIKYLEDKINILVGFVESDSVNALLGQEGFFDNYRVKFEKDHNIFEINPIKKK